MAEVLFSTGVPAITEAIEQNLAELLFYFGAANNATITNTHRLIAVLSDSDDAFCNAVVHSRLTPERLDEEILTVLAPFQRRNVPMIWWLMPSAAPPELGKRLARHGLRYRGEGPGMGLDLTTLPRRRLAPEGLTVELVRTPAALREWLYVSNVAYGYAREPIEQSVIDFEQRLGLGEKQPYRRYLARLYGRAVATAAIFLGAGVAGLYNVATIPQARRHGIGSYTSFVALREARKAGYCVSVLMASAAGYHVYTGLGFREYCRIRSFAWRA